MSSRYLQIFAAVLIGLILSPLLILICLILMVFQGYPIFFRQLRLGKNEVVFSLYKFRTMEVNSSRIKNGLAVSKNDSRVTKIGSVLRKTSLDELPQLFNIIRGDINFIGPRAMLPQQLSYLSPKQKQRFTVKPGLVGLATVNGRASIPWSRRIELDLLYIERRSLFLDLRILLLSFWTVLSGANVYYDHRSNGPAFDLAPPDYLPQDDIK